MNRLVPWLRFGVLIIAVFAAAVSAMLNSFNHFGSVESRFAGICTPVAGIPGPEDIQIDASRRRAFISSLDRRAAPDQRGAIYAVSIDNPLASSSWRDRTMGAPAAFRPLGISYYQDGEVQRLFVINEATNSVELYDVQENGDLAHAETLTERRLTSPNNIVAVGPRSFYLSNDVERGRDTAFGQLHFLGRVGSGKIMYYSGQAWLLAAEGLRFANGLALSPDGRRLYAAETAGQPLLLFDRAPETGVLTLAQTAPLGAAPDNLTIGDDGAVWIGALPKPLAVPAHGRDPGTPAPSLVLRYEEGASPLAGLVEIYRNAGDEISASTVAAVLGRKLLIGSLWEDKFLLCDMPRKPSV